jgi:hypothetical protein
MAFILQDVQRTLLFKDTCDAVNLRHIYLYVLEDFMSQFFADRGFIICVQLIKLCFSYHAREVEVKGYAGGHMSPCLPSGVQQMSPLKHRKLLTYHYSATVCSTTRFDETIPKHEMASTTCRSYFAAHFLNVLNYP